MQARERALTPSPFVVFNFGLIVESIKEFGGGSLDVGYWWPTMYKDVHDYYDACQRT